MTVFSGVLPPINLMSLKSRQAGVNADALEVAVYFAAGGIQSSIQLFVASLSFGILTALAGVAFVFLSRQGLFARKSVTILFLSTFILYSSTSIFLTVLVWNRLSVSKILSQIIDNITSSTYDLESSTSALARVVSVQSWMMTITAGLNIIIGDAVVWWRACVVWRSKYVYYTGPPLLALTLIFGLINVRNASAQITGNSSLQLQMLIGVDGFADSFMILSMVTNLVATSLIAYKAWQHRRMVKKYFKTDGSMSTTWKALALLVESGTIYCALLMFLAIYQVTRPAEITSSASAFAQTGWYFTDGCLLPIAAIYPTFIIVLVAMKRSPIDRGVSQVTRTPGTQAEPVHSTLVFHHTTAGTGASVESTVDRHEFQDGNDGGQPQDSEVKKEEFCEV